MLELFNFLIIDTKDPPIFLLLCFFIGGSIILLWCFLSIENTEHDIETQKIELSYNTRYNYHQFLALAIFCWFLGFIISASQFLGITIYFYLVLVVFMTMLSCLIFDD